MFLVGQKPMPRTIVGKLLAFALVIAPAYYCAPSWAQKTAIEREATKEAVKAAPEVKGLFERLRAWWNNEPEAVRDRTKELPFEPLKECGQELVKKGTCKDASQ
jgi:hypothetical protein